MRYQIIQAQAKAEANRIISESITEATQRQDAIGKWNGELPRYAGGGDVTFGILESVTSTPTSRTTTTAAPSPSPSQPVG